MKFDREELFTFDPGEPFPELPLGYGLPEDIVCVTKTIDPERLPIAYSQGIFPWYQEGEPVFWWMTDPRMVLQTKNFKVSHSLRKRLKRALQFNYEGKNIILKIDSCTDRVIASCALISRHDQDGTWITKEIFKSYLALAEKDLVHSVEVFVDNELRGGLYGVSLGRMFYGESMFSTSADLSKIALSLLVCICKNENVPWIDCQQETEHLKSLGASSVSLKEFKEHLNQYCKKPPVDWNKYRGKELNSLLEVFA